MARRDSQSYLTKYIQNPLSAAFSLGRASAADNDDDQGHSSTTGDHDDASGEHGHHKKKAAGPFSFLSGARASASDPGDDDEDTKHSAGIGSAVLSSLKTVASPGTYLPGGILKRQHTTGRMSTAASSREEIPPSLATELSAMTAHMATIASEMQEMRKQVDTLTTSNKEKDEVLNELLERLGKLHKVRTIHFRIFLQCNSHWASTDPHNLQHQLVHLCIPCLSVIGDRFCPHAEWATGEERKQLPQGEHTQC